MSTNTYSTVRQRQPLRVPNTFKDQERQLVIQIEWVLDDIYKRFGRLGMDDMSNSFRFVIDNKYDKISGITIDEDGVEIVGNKYVKISTTGGGEWEYNQNGLRYYKTGDPLPFQIARYADRDYLTSGLFYNYSESEQTGEVILLAECRNGQHTSTSGFWRGELAFAMTDNPSDLDTDTIYGLFYPRASTGVLGTRQKPWLTIFTRDIRGKLSSDNGPGVIAFSPDPRLAKRDFGIQFQETEYDDSGVTKDRVTITSTTSPNKFVVLGKASEENQIIGFNLISGVKHIVGQSGQASFVMRPNPAAGKETVRLVINESVVNNSQRITIYKDAGVDELLFQGNVTGNLTGNVTGNLTGNIVKSSGAAYVYPNGTNNIKLQIFGLTVGGVDRIQLSSDGEFYLKNVKFNGAATGNLTGNVTGDLTGNVTGNVTGDVTGKLNGNVVKSTGTFSVYPSGTSSARLNIFQFVQNGESYIQLSSDNADYVTFKGNADTATKLSRAPTYGELSGRP